MEHCYPFIISKTPYKILKPDCRPNATIYRVPQRSKVEKMERSSFRLKGLTHLKEGSFKDTISSAIKLKIDQR
jgi:hypothetical protein